MASAELFDPVDLTSKRNPLDQVSSRREADILHMVADAVRHDHALLAFQPVVLAQTTTSVAFHEGLIRILDPAGRIVPAREFMPLVENSELGRAIDRLALDLGCRTLSQVRGLRLSINMSAKSIGFEPWIATLERWLRADETIGPRLILEITEGSAMTAPDLVVEFMNRMRLRGVCLALDDFGSGCTSLRYFKDFAFDILKIDGQFIRGIAHDPDNRFLTEAMLSIGHHFEMLCVAEMVEMAEEAEILAGLGADCLQGYHFGAPTVTPAWLPASTRLRLTA